MDAPKYFNFSYIYICVCVGDGLVKKTCIHAGLKRRRRNKPKQGAKGGEN